MESIFRGLRKVLFCVVNYNNKGATAGSVSESSKRQVHLAFGPEEMRLLAKLLDWGLDCLRLHSHRSVSTAEEEREAIIAFGSIFKSLSKDAFADLFASQLPRWMQRLAHHSALMGMADVFLKDADKGAPFAALLLSYISEVASSLIDAPALVELAKRALRSAASNEGAEAAVVEAFLDLPLA